MFSTESMKKLRVFLAPLLFSLANADRGEIQVCVNARQVGVSTALSGARVECFDEDWDEDDEMTTGTTGSDGCATLLYENKQRRLLNPCAGWDCGGFIASPDIYCKITKPGYFPLFTDTKEDWNQDRTATFGTVNIYPLRRCWKQRDFEGQTCSEGERITQYTATLDQCQTDCELDSDCSFVYWQSAEDVAALSADEEAVPDDGGRLGGNSSPPEWQDVAPQRGPLTSPEEAVHHTALCNRYRSCDQKELPTVGGTTYQVGDCSGLTNGCGPAYMSEGMRQLADDVSRFEQQCNNHDLCYSDCSETQEMCDEEFLDMMHSECNDRVEVSAKGGCYLMARSMYAAVNNFGADAHFGAQQKAGCIGQ